MLASDSGIEPDNWFSSTWNLFIFRRLPSSSGKLPDNILPFRSLHRKYIRITLPVIAEKKNHTYVGNSICSVVWLHHKLSLVAALMFLVLYISDN